jgi:mannose-6-phosphate isomerase-like protein (cupin superfamily)
MTTTTQTTQVEPGQRIDPTRQLAGIDRPTRRAVLVEQLPGRPPRRIDGLTIGAPQITSDPPHDGEVHPDADEVLYLISGAMTVRLELPDGHREVELSAGEALVVRQGVWHKVTTKEPGQLLHITPGPNGDARIPAQTGSRA